MVNRRVTVLNENVHFLRQGIDLARRLDDSRFREAPGGDRRRTVGCQLRHIIDHYRSFLDGIAAGTVDYDRRQRDPVLEEDREAAATCLERIAEQLASLPGEALERAVTVRMDTGGDPPAAWSGSTGMRELQFLLSHTVHHYALIGLLLAHQGFEVADQFGVAPSTLRHWNAEAACAPHAG